MEGEPAPIGSDIRDQVSERLTQSLRGMRINFVDGKPELPSDMDRDEMVSLLGQVSMALTDIVTLLAAEIDALRHQLDPPS